MDESPKIGEAKPAAPHENATQTENDKIDAISERVIAAFVKINRTNRKADAAENERNHRREQRRFKVELIEIFLIAVYAIVTVFEWHTFSTESNTMQTELQTVQSNSITEERFEKLQLNEMKRTPELDERAWLFTVTTDNSLTIKTNVPIINITMKNSGKTPAIIIGTLFGVTANTNDISPIVSPVSGLRVYLNPNAAQSFSIPIPDFAGLQIQNGNPIYVYGICFYDDIFGNHHWTQFCYCLSDHGMTMTQPNFHNACDTETNQSD